MGGGHLYRQWNPFDPNMKGFLNFYSTTGVCEDSAEIYSYCFSEADRLYLQQDNMIKRKVGWMKKFQLEYCNIDESYWTELLRFRNILNYH